MNLILLSDLHLGQSAADEARLGANLKRIVAAHPNATHMVILGDLSDVGQIADYAALQAHIDALPLPVSLLMGNHDDRGSFRQVFGPEGCDKPVQSIARAGDWPLYLLDTSVPGQDGGSLDGGRLDWLDAALAAATQPGFVFMHHPPIGTATPAFARIGLDDRKGFADLVARHRSKIEAIFFGHCHMQVHGLVSQVPAFGLASTHTQSRPHFDEDRFGSDPFSPAAYGYLVTDETGFSFHSVPMDLLS